MRYNLLEQLHIWTDTNLGKKLNKFSYNSEILAFCAEEYDVDYAFDLSTLSNPKNVSFVFGSAGIEKKFYKQYFKMSKRTDFWYNFWLYQSAEKIDITNLLDPINSCLFISLNYKEHSHRCLMLDILKKHKLVKDNIISWHGVDALTTYKWKYWKPETMYLTDNFKNTQRQHRVPLEYNNALFNLVAESTTDVIFVTEKTWHAILCKKPFIVLGAVGFHRFLKSKGYKLFEDLIDYSFDQEKNLEKRTEMLVLELKKLEQQDYNSLYQKIKHVCEYNQSLAFQHIRNQEGVPNLAKQFKYYQEIIKEAQCRSDISV